MLGSMAMPAFAVTAVDPTDTAGNYTAGTNDSADDWTKARSTTVKYDVTATYEWTIHSEVDLGESSTSKSDQQVNVTKNVIPEGKKLQITVKGQGSNGEFQVVNQVPDGSGTKNGTVIRNYTIKSDKGNSSSSKENVETGKVVMEVLSATNTKTAKVDFELVDNTDSVVPTAGSYKGTVTYTANIVDVSATIS